MGTRGPKPGTGGRPKKAIADKIAEGNTGHRPLTVIDFGDSAADLEGQAMPYTKRLDKLGLLRKSVITVTQI